MSSTLVSASILAALVSLAGCFGLYGCLAGPVDYHRNHLADDLICMIDESVMEEIDEKLPNGFLGLEYSPAIWARFWNERVSALSASDFVERHEGYVGPTSHQLLLYALAQRRNVGLPDLEPTTETKVVVESLYREMGEADVSICSHLEGRDPVCFLPPAQYPGTSESRRLARQCSEPIAPQGT